MNSLLFTIGLFIKVWFVGDIAYIQPNNKYVWVEYNETRHKLKEKEIFEIPLNAKVTVGIE